MKSVSGKSTLITRSTTADPIHGGRYMANYSQFLNEMITKPQVVTQADQIMLRSGKDVQAFYAGCEYGNARGFDAGFGKGIVVGAICTLAILALAKK